MRDNADPHIQLPLRTRPSLLDCQRCGLRPARYHDAETSPLNRYHIVCVDVRACHRRMMRDRLHVIPGSATY